MSSFTTEKHNKLLIVINSNIRDYRVGIDVLYNISRVNCEYAFIVYAIIAGLSDMVNLKFVRSKMNYST